MKKVSVIIPTYNRENTIERALQSVLKQTYTNLEVLVMDDGSTDGTEKLFARITDPRVKYVKLETNAGPSHARNMGAKMAEGERLAFQDSDDYWYPNKLEKQIAYAQEHPEYALIYCSYRLFVDEEYSIVPEIPYVDKMEGYILNTLLKQNTIGTPTIMVDRKLFLEYGGFSTEYKSLEDWEFVIRFSKENQIGFIPEPLMDAHLLRGGVSSNLPAYFASRCRMLAAYKKDMENAGVLDAVMLDILQRAKDLNVLEGVKRMIIHYMS